jgi:hypothetical protein
MTDWNALFTGLRQIVRTTDSTAQGLTAVVTFAQALEQPNFWSSVAKHDFRESIATVTGWGKDGLNQFELQRSWDILILDLGDCPDVFCLYHPNYEPALSKEKLVALLPQPSIAYTDLENCIAPNHKVREDGAYYEFVELYYTYLNKLEDSLLTRPLSATTADSQYLLWLAVGTFALLEPLRNPAYCKKILNGYQKIYLFTGFEEVFFYLASVTPTGLQFE